MGLQFPFESTLVSDFRFAEMGHKTLAAKPMDLGILETLITMAVEGEGMYKTMAGFVLLAAGACLRFRHLQRSVLTSTDAGFITAYCKIGKTRRQGLRPGFSWSAPRCWTAGGDVMLEVLRAQKEMAKNPGYPENPYMIPDVDLRWGPASTG